MLKHRGSGDGGRNIGSGGSDEGEGTGAAVAVVATLSMAPADSSGGNSGGRQEWRRQAETEAVAGADNNQPESRSDSSEYSDRGGGGDGGDRDGGSRDGAVAAAGPTVAETATDAAAAAVAECDRCKRVSIRFHVDTKVSTYLHRFLFVYL